MSALIQEKYRVVAEGLNFVGFLARPIWRRVLEERPGERLLDSLVDRSRPNVLDTFGTEALGANFL